MISIIQIMASVFSLFALSRVFLRAKDKKISTVEFIFWLCLWCGFIVVVIFPSIISKVATILGISRGTDLILYGSVGILFYMIFRLYVKAEEIEREITVIVRQKALEKKKK